VDRPEELFDREDEFKELRDALNGRWTVLLLGVRRVGKTSLARAATYNRARVYIDLK
jgi:Predicted ATPase (AAA+ superfamily)